MRIRHLACLLCIMASGCITMTTPEQKAMMMKRQGDHSGARREYISLYNGLRSAATNPVWNGEEYQYKIDRAQVARYIEAIAETYRNQGDDDNAIYWYCYYVQFCSRHQISNPERVQSIKDYAEKARKGTNAVNRAFEAGK